MADDLGVKTALWKAQFGNDFSDLAEYVRNGQKFLLDDKEAREFIADVLTGKRKNKVAGQPHSFFHKNQKKYTQICSWFAYFKALGLPRWEATGDTVTALLLTSKKTGAGKSIKPTDTIRRALKVTYCRRGHFYSGVERGLKAKFYIEKELLSREAALDSWTAINSITESEEESKYFESAAFLDMCDLIVKELLDGDEGMF